MNEQDFEQLTLFPADSPASRSVLPGSSEARKMTVTSGRKCLELYARSDQLGCLVRMCLESSIWRSTRCLLTWRTKVTPSRRLLFQLRASMPRTSETESQLSDMTKTERWAKNIENEDGQPRLWKTPIASDAANREFYHNSRGEPNLSGMVKLWPTPRVGGSRGNSPVGAKHGDLAAVAGGQLNPTWVEWLMGYPIGWTDLSASETPSCHRLSSPSSGQ